MNRREFLSGTSLAAFLRTLSWKDSLFSGASSEHQRKTQVEDFHSQAFAALPLERSYAFHRELSEGGRQMRRDSQAKPTPAEMAIPENGWVILVKADASEPLRRAVEDLRAYFEISMGTHVSEETAPSLTDWVNRRKAIVVGTRQDLPGCGTLLKGSKDHQIKVTPDQVVVCGFDEPGAMYGLYNLEERMDLREAPFLPRDLDTTRHSLFKVRMTMSGLGWTEWPDKYLACVARHGFDAIFTSEYSNPNGAAAPSWLADIPYGVSYLFRKQDPARLQDVVRRAARYGIRVYCPIMYQLDDTTENEEGLRKLTRDIVTQFPEIRGYVLLTEGFWYKKWFGAGCCSDTASAASSDAQAVDLYDWVRHWAKGVSIVAEECHKLDPTIEVLPWDYNIDFRDFQVDLKKYVIDQLPRDTIPLVTWENGKSFALDGESAYVRDYSISQSGPSEAAAAQIAEAKKRGMPGIYTNADTFSSNQFGTFPYLPFPYQWYERYRGLEEHGIDGTLESWSIGLKPNFVAEMRAWYCWSDAPALDVLLRQIARRDFGPGSEELVLDAWKQFSAAIRMVPDTGPTAGGNNAVANPLFFEEPEPHIMTLKHSFWDQGEWDKATNANPYWPYVFRDYLFYPDFTNRVNNAEEYAKPFSLKVFKKYLELASEQMEKGLQSYRRAALNAPASKKQNAFREVLLAEQIERMMRSNEAMVEFEDLRFQLATTTDPSKRTKMLDHMAEILEHEIVRTQASLETARRDSRLGFEWENDYMYWPGVIEKKLELLQVTLNEQIPAYRRRHTGDR